MRATVVLYDGCTITEVAEIATRLANWDVQVEFAAATTQELRDQSGLRMLPDRALAEIDPTGLTAVLVPGGDPASVLADDAVLGWLRRASEAGAIVAAICAGVTVVAAAGLTAGRRITHNHRSPWASPEHSQTVEHLWADARIEPDRTIGVVRDANLITALPNFPVEFAMEVLVAIGLYDRRRASLMGAHLKGGYVEELYVGS